MPENAERDRLKELVTGQGQVLVEGSVDYAASASFSYLSHDGHYLVSVTRAAPDVPVTKPEPAPNKSEVKKVVPAPKPVVPAPKPEVKAASAPEVKMAPKLEVKPASAPKVAHTSPVSPPRKI